MKVCGADVSRLPNLATLHMENNQLTHLPDSIGQCPSLTKLICSTNMLTSLPSSLQHLKKVQRLDFGNNVIKKVPAVIGRLRTLKEFNLRYNSLDKQFQAAADEGLSKFLTFLKREAEREEAEARERMRPIGTQVPRCHSAPSFSTTRHPDSASWRPAWSLNNSEPTVADRFTCGCAGWHVR